VATETSGNSFYVSTACGHVLCFGPIVCIVFMLIYTVVNKLGSSCIKNITLHNQPNNSTEQSPSWEANSHSAGQEIPCLLWNPKVHYRVHNSPHWPLSWATCIQSTPPHPISLICVLILSSHLRLGLPSALTLRLFNQNFVCISSLSHACYMPRQSHTPWFDFPNNILIWHCIK
jgi:hypothetical protein